MYDGIFITIIVIIVVGVNHGKPLTFHGPSGLGLFRAILLCLSAAGQNRETRINHFQSLSKPNTR